MQVSPERIKHLLISIIKAYLRASLRAGLKKVIQLFIITSFAAVRKYATTGPKRKKGPRKAAKGKTVISMSRQGKIGSFKHL